MFVRAECPGVPGARPGAGTGFRYVAALDQPLVVGLDGGEGGTEFVAAGRDNYVTVTFWPGQAVGPGSAAGKDLSGIIW